jgi:hypothetical protein
MCYLIYVKGIDVNSYLKTFWKKMYSSHLMTLAVISNGNNFLCRNFFTPTSSVILASISRCPAILYLFFLQKL